MQITRKKSKAHIERNIITGMITSTPFMKEFRRIYEPDFMLVDQIRTVADWCIDYWDEFGEVPNNHIRDLFQKHEKQLDEEHSEYIVQFLSSISEEHDRIGKFNDK